jgi:hypothetical protein
VIKKHYSKKLERSVEIGTILSRDGQESFNITVYIDFGEHEDDSPRIAGWHFGDYTPQLAEDFIGFGLAGEKKAVIASNHCQEFYGDEPRFTAVAAEINAILDKEFAGGDISKWVTMFGPTSIEGTAVNWMLRVYGTPANGSPEIEFVYDCENCTVTAFENHTDEDCPGTVFFEQIADVLQKYSFFIAKEIIKAL